MAGECGTSLRQRGCYQRHLAGTRVKRDGTVGHSGATSSECSYGFVSRCMS